MAFDRDWLMRAAAIDGKVVDDAGGLHSGKGANFFEDVVEEGDFVHRASELVAWCNDGHGENVVRIEAGVDAAE
jgi:hypothetical protein